ncbi:MAG TPA: hypothetical protein VFM18_01920, partial [Methanosarcina sp.]|nr:hypothetical protein [Methanosarcina sp.]
MIAYSYDKVTGELLGEEEADESPLCPGEFLVPAFSTLTPPPEAEDRKKAVYKDGSWALVDDYRGFKFWDNRGRSFIISELGVAPPKNVLLSRPGRCLPVRMNKFRKALLLFGLLDKVQLEIANIEDPFIRQCAEVD